MLRSGLPCFLSCLCLVLVASSAAGVEPQTERPALPAPETGDRVFDSTPAGSSDTPARVMTADEIRALSSGVRAGDAPVAIPDAYLVQSNDVLTVPGSNGLLLNDFDPEGDAFWAVSYSQTYNGITNMATDGSFTYTPDPGYVGADSLIYTISDGTSYSDGGKVYFEILPPANRPPVAVADVYMVTYGEALSVSAAGGLLLNDFDPDGDSISVVSYQAPSHGVLNMATDGSFTYTPDTGFVGTETIVYTIYDGQVYNDEPGQLTFQVMAPLNREPVAQRDWYYTPSDTPLTVTTADDVMRNDLDPDGDSFYVVSYISPQDGALSLYTNGTFTYTPDPGFAGSDVFRYRLKDSNDGYSEFMEVTLLVGVYGDIASGVLTPPAAEGFTLRAPVPNPFNPATDISFRTGEEGRVQLRVMNLRGEVVATLVDEVRPAGEHTVSWTGRDETGRPAASGTYFAELREGGKRAVQKLTLIK